MAGPLKNARQEKFAQELAKGKSQLDAYVAAGYKPDRGAASRLLANVNVSVRIDELKARAAEKAAITAADIAMQLDEDRVFARHVEQAAAAVSATMGKAKVLGLIKEKHEHTGNVTLTVSPEDASL
jgi:phage terminase small subunit